MNKKIYFSIALLGSILLSVEAVADHLNFSTDLSGAQEEPGVITSAGGSASFSFDSALSEASFDLRVFGSGITQAHLHCAPAGVNGPIVVFLFGPANPGQNLVGTPIKGIIFNEDIIPPDDNPICGRVINNIASLFAAMRAGEIYVNVHSNANPSGVIRGQVFE